jgi:hypothetical protein
VDFYNRPLPPALGLGTVAELRRWHQADPRNLELQAFNPVEFACHEVGAPELVSSELSDAYQALNQDWLSGNGDTASRRLFNAVDKHLAARDWSHLPTHPAGFAVVAVDIELGDYERDIKATVPAALRRALLGDTPQPR